MAWNKYVNVEVPLFLSFFCIILQKGVIENLSIYRTCYVTLGYKEANCSLLGKVENDTTKELEKLVQPTINKMNMADTIVSSLTLVLCLYVGIWSDKFGRKPFILLCSVGNTLNSVIYTFFMFFHNVSPWWFLTAQIPTIFTGNFTAFMILLSTYVADITTDETRMLKFAIFQVTFTAAQVSGGFLTPVLIYHTSYEFIFCLITALQIITLLYTYFLLPESFSKKKEKFQVGNLLKYINFLEIIQTTLKRRPNNGRFYVLINLLITLLTGFSMGEMCVSSLFLRAKLQFTVTNISYLSSITSMGSVFFTAIGTYVLYQKLGFKEIPLALFATIASVAASFLRAIATNQYYIYAASSIGICSAMGDLMLKTILTFLIAPDEMGKVLALIDILASLIGTLAYLIYPLIYNFTINYNPGIYNYVTFGIYIIKTIIIASLLGANIPHYVPEKVEEKEAPKETIKY